jgi:hypothetical protein
VTSLRTPAEESRREISLAAGSYDVSVQAADGSMVGGTTFAVSPGERREIDLSEDRRPTVVIRVPPLPPVPEAFRRHFGAEPGDPSVDRWVASATRRTPPEGPVGALAMSTSGRASAAETLAAFETLSNDAVMLRLSGTGLFQIHLSGRRGSLEHRLFREVMISEGEVLELEVPPLEATLRGTMKRFTSDLGFSHHGVAGPRLLLIPEPPSEDPRAWGIVCGVPPRVGPEKEGAFELTHLPPGPALLFHHLSGRTQWGGQPVELRAGEVEDVGELAALPARTLDVTVLDAEGLPVRDATLRIRDRMDEAWAAFTLIPTTGIYASDPIPAPPAIPLEAGRASVPSVRAGWLEIEVALDAGRTVSWIRPVDPERGLTLRLPP